MSLSKSWAEWWRSFLSFSADVHSEAVEILRRLYIEESQHATRFTQQAQRMPYPQFRAKLLEIAAEEDKHAAWIAEKINLLGGRLPAVPETEPAGRNSWELLLADLADETRCAGELLETSIRLERDLPGIAEMLRRIGKDGAKHRNDLRNMLMRSDPQARLAA